MSVSAWTRCRTVADRSTRASNRKDGEAVMSRPDRDPEASMRLEGCRRAAPRGRGGGRSTRIAIAMAMSATLLGTSVVDALQHRRASSVLTKDRLDLPISASRTVARNSSILAMSAPAAGVRSSGCEFAFGEQRPRRNVQHDADDPRAPGLAGLRGPRAKRGATMVEYGLLIALIAVVVAVAADAARHQHRQRCTTTSRTSL